MDKFIIQLWVDFRWRCVRTNNKNSPRSQSQSTKDWTSSAALFLIWQLLRIDLCVTFPFLCDPCGKPTVRRTLSNTFVVRQQSLQLQIERSTSFCWFALMDFWLMILDGWLQMSDGWQLSLQHLYCHCYGRSNCNNSYIIKIGIWDVEYGITYITTGSKELYIALFWNICQLPDK